ncbi:MAG: response regulator [Spirochaetales bacterium]|nr:response regulator [Spirochaetales bacterium]
MKPKVLVAEDNIDHLELLSDALSEENIVIGTDSKEGCMNHLAHEQFDLVVLDYNLKKDFSGFDILREITLKYPHIPVIMVTAYGNEELAVKVMKIGAKDYIRKTLDNNYIDRIVRNVRTLVRKKGKEEYKQIKKDVLTFLKESTEDFIKRWKDKIHVYEKRFEIPETMILQDSFFKKLHKAFLDDLSDDKISRTLDTLKGIFKDNIHDEWLLLNIELLNVSFREITHDLLLEKYPNFFDYGSALMDQISWIVDANDLVLSKEYEKLIDKSVEDVRKIEHYTANESLIRQLREELQGSTLNIEENTQKILNDPTCARDKILKDIIKHLKQMDIVLNKFEKTTKNNLETYKKKIKKYKL